MTSHEECSHLHFTFSKDGDDVCVVCGLCRPRPPGSETVGGHHDDRVDAVVAAAKNRDDLAGAGAYPVVVLGPPTVAGPCRLCRFDAFQRRVRYSAVARVLLRLNDTNGTVKKVVDANDLVDELKTNKKAVDAGWGSKPSNMYVHGVVELMHRVDAFVAQPRHTYHISTRPHALEALGKSIKKVNEFIQPHSQRLKRLTKIVACGRPPSTTDLAISDGVRIQTSTDAMLQRVAQVRRPGTAEILTARAKEVVVAINAADRDAANRALRSAWEQALGDKPATDLRGEHVALCCTNDDHLARMHMHGSDCIEGIWYKLPLLDLVKETMMDDAAAHDYLVDELKRTLWGSPFMHQRATKAATTCYVLLNQMRPRDDVEEAVFRSTLAKDASLGAAAAAFGFYRCYMKPAFESVNSLPTAVRNCRFSVAFGRFEAEKGQGGLDGCVYARALSIKSFIDGGTLPTFHDAVADLAVPSLPEQLPYRRFYDFRRFVNALIAAEHVRSKTGAAKQDGLRRVNEMTSETFDDVCASAAKGSLGSAGEAYGHATSFVVEQKLRPTVDFPDHLETLRRRVSSAAARITTVLPEFWPDLFGATVDVDAIKEKLGMHPAVALFIPFPGDPTADDDGDYVATPEPPAKKPVDGLVAVRKPKAHATAIVAASEGGLAQLVKGRSVTSRPDTPMFKSFIGIEHVAASLGVDSSFVRHAKGLLRFWMEKPAEAKGLLQLCIRRQGGGAEVPSFDVLLQASIAMHQENATFDQRRHLYASKAVVDFVCHSTWWYESDVALKTVATEVAKVYGVKREEKTLGNYRNRPLDAVASSHHEAAMNAGLAVSSSSTSPKRPRSA